MTTQLSSLAVRPDLDPSKFEQGAQRLDAAASSAGKAVAGIGVASDEVNRKISQAGDVVGRLSRQYVDGYASAQRFQSALNSLSREMEKGNLSIQRAQPILDGIYRKYGLMGDAAQFAAKGQTELAAAITNANARIEQQRRIVPANGNILPANGNARVSSGMAQAAGFNAGQQLQDILMMSALGQSPGALALQQGPQLASAIQMGGGLAALKTGLVSLLSPTMLLTTGLVGLTAVAIQYFSSSETESKKVEEALKREKSMVDDLAKSYGAAAEAAKGRSTAGILGANFGARDSARELEFLLREQSKNYAGPTTRGQLGRLGVPLIGNNSQFDMSFLAGPNGTTQIGRIDPGSQFKPFEDAIRHLFETARAGTPDFMEFRKAVLDEWHTDPNNDALTKTTRILLDATKAGLGLAEAFREAKRAEQELLQNVGPNGMLKASGSWAQADMGNLSAFQNQQNVAARRSQEAFDADIQALYARSPAERAAAARAQAAAQYSNDESSPARKQRIDLAGQRAQIEAQHQLDEAQLQRKRSLDATLASQQLDLDLIGKTTGQAEALRLQFQLTQQLREEAARNNIPVDQKELDLIKQKAEAYGKMAEAIARARLKDQYGFSREQLFRTPMDQQIASIQRGAGLPVDLSSSLAKEMRSQADIANIRGGIDTFFSTFTQEAETQGTSIGKALMDALQAGVLSELNSIIKGLTDQLTAWLTKWISDAAGLGGAGTGSGATGVVGDAVKMLAANQNTPSSMTAFASAIKSIESGGNYNALGPVTASGDRAYGAYQVMGANIAPWTKQALGSSLSPSQFLGSQSAQDAVFAQQFGRYVTKFGPSGAAQAWFGGPGSVGSGGSASDILGTTGTAYVDRFNDSLKSMAGATSGATQSLSTFGTGLGQVGQNLQQASSSFGSGGGGGLFGALGSLFGGGGSDPWAGLRDVTTTIGARSWDVGGYTGPGGRLEPAGLVHRGEYVFDAAATSRIGVNNLERLRKLPGYADGGLVGAPANSNAASQSGPDVKVEVNNAPPGTRVRESRNRGPNGKELRKIVVDLVDEHAADGGFDGAFGSLYGLRRNGTAR